MLEGQDYGCPARAANDGFFRLVRAFIVARHMAIRPEEQFADGIWAKEVGAFRIGKITDSIVQPLPVAWRGQHSGGDVTNFRGHFLLLLLIRRAAIGWGPRLAGLPGSAFCR